MSIYEQSELYGGQRDENRDARPKLKAVTTRDPEAILIAEDSGKIIGTVSLIEDGRVAWLFRFAVLKTNIETAVLEQLQKKAFTILKSRGHNQVIVYSPAANGNLD